MKLRRTKKQLERERVEQAELARRVREDEPVEPVSPDPLRTNVVTTPVLPEVVEYHKQIRELAASGLPAPDVTLRKFACEKHQWHGPDPRKPTPPAALCPFCSAKPEPNETGHYFSDGGGPVKDVPMSPAAEALWELRLQAREARGEVLPGRDAEDEALARIDRLRDEETAEMEEKQRRDDFYREHRGDPNAIYMPRRRKRSSAQRRTAAAIWRTNERGNIEVDA
jgi:hypothetical protein